MSTFGLQAEEFHFVNGARVRQARELRGLTQAELARRVGVTQAMIAHIEGSLKQPSRGILQAIAAQTALPESFFCQDSPPELPTGSLLFRARAGASRRELNEAYRHAQLVFEVWLRLSPRVNTVPVRLKPVEADPETAAARTRESMGLTPHGPVPHLLRSFEKAGGVLLALPKLENRDAFAVWAGKLPVIAVSASLPADRMRMTVAHEIGHLVLHRQIGPKTSELERQAYIFAAELLMPRESITQDFGKGTDLLSLARMKLRWSVSIQALIRRARDLGFITERQYRSFFQQLSIRGWRKLEPVTLPAERPRGLRRMVDVLFDQTPTSAIAKELRLTPAIVNEILERYAPAPTAESSKPSRPKRGKILSFRAAH